jgi:CDP-2,3-bis-(O-geranylgeranyl)-sn-glycerol synthase
MDIVIQTFWFLLPAGIANMSPIIFRWVPFLNFPIDFNQKINGKPIFGKNKTYRGFFVGILIAILITYIQRLLYDQTASIAIIDYSSINIYLLGFLFGFGALFGDLIKSFIKRRCRIAPGKSWMPLDQIDWIIGALVFSWFYVSISWQHMVVAVILFSLLHPLANLVGYLLHVQKNKF